MKRILTVLALLAVCGMAFSVTGSLFVRYNGGLVATEWGSLDDIRVGHPNSGFQISTDTWGVHYNLRSAYALPTIGASAVNGNTAYSGIAQAYTPGTSSLTGPGYIQLTGLKLGGASADIGGAFWIAGNTSANLTTNVLGTNVQNAGNYGYNYFAFNLDFNVPLTEKISFQAYPWDKIQFDIGGGSATYNAFNAVTNTGSSSIMKLVLPLHLDISGMDPISIGLFPKMAYSSQSEANNGIGVTNAETQSSTELGFMARIGYKINSVWGIYAHVGIDSQSSSDVLTTTTVTNSQVASQLDAPLMIGLTFNPAGWVNMHIGIGYNAKLSSSTTTILANVTNISSVTSGTFASGYGFFDEHAYQNPFLQLAGSSKFATDWELGLNTVVSMNGGVFPGSTGINSDTKNTYGYSNSDGAFTWANNWNWDNNAYLKFAKDAVSITGAIGGSSTSGVLGLFSQIDMSIAF